MGMSSKAINQSNHSTKGTKMKRIITTTTLIVAMIGTSITNTQGAAQPANGSLKTAVDQMVRSIDRSLGIFEGLDRSQREKMAEFDKILAQINYSIKVTAADGSLAKKISRAVSLANQQAEWCVKTADAKDNDALAERYRRLGEVSADKAVRIEKNAALVLAMNTELAKLYPAINEEKEFFFAALEAGEDLDHGFSVDGLLCTEYDGPLHRVATCIDGNEIDARNRFHGGQDRIDRPSRRQREDGHRDDHRPARGHLLRRSAPRKRRRYDG